MALQLHIWGPAFGLPSIDAECISAVAFLNASLPQGEWSLVAAHDPSQSPTKDFPALYDGDTWVGGLTDIIQHVKRHPLAKDIDAGLDPQQRADSTAFMSFLHSTALPLIDLTLYASFQNYYHKTGPAWTRILPLPLNYTIPPRRRAAARARAAPLGLSSLDVDTVHESVLESNQTPNERFEAEKRAAGLPTDEPGPGRSSMLSFNRLKSKTLLDRTQHSTLFRLSNLLSSLCDPLVELKADKLYLQSVSNPTTLDCLALGYFSLLFYPKMPMSFLSETIASKYPSLTSYIRHLRASLLENENAIHAMPSISALRSNPEAFEKLKEDKRSSLPWILPQNTPLSASFANTGREICSSLPGLSRLYREPILQTNESSTSLTAPLMPFIAAGTTMLGAAATVVYYFMTLPKTDNLVFESPNRAQRAPSFGDLGAALGMFSGGGGGEIATVGIDVADNPSN